MTIRNIGLAMMMALCVACSSQEYSYPMHFETLLNDRSILTFDVTIFMEDDEGMDELKKKADQVEYGMRIIMSQRPPEQIDNAKRIKSVMRKICDSQMVHRVEKFDVTSMAIKRYVGYSKYEDAKPIGVSRKGLTGQ